VRAELSRAEADKHDEADSRFSIFAKEPRNQAFQISMIEKSNGNDR